MLFLHDLYTYIVPIFLANFIVGIVSWPLANKFFGKLSDRGYAAGHIIGWLSISLATFTLAIFHNRIFPLNITTVRLLMSAWVLINLFIYKIENLRLSKTHIKTILINQVIFFTLLVALTYIKGTDGNIYRGERLMNFSIINALQKSDELPLSDFWLSGNVLNYYYFGHFVGYIILNLAGVSIFNGFFVLEAWLFTTLAINLFYLGKLLYIKTSEKNKNGIGNIAGLLSVFFILISGTFYTIAWFIKSSYNKMLGIDIYGFPSTFSIGYIKGTITEIPILSFLIQELHAHTWDLLIITLIITVLILIWFESPKLNLYILLGVLLGTVYMTNPWDILMYSVLIVMSTFLLLPLKRGVIYLTATIGICLLTILPFTKFFVSPVTQLGLVMDHTPIIKWLIIWGPFALITLFFVKTNYKNLANTKYSFYFLILSIISMVFVCTELIFFKDINVNNIWYRGNTVFKFWYQIWFIWALILGPMAVNIATKLNSRIKKYLYGAVTSCILFAQVLYALVMLQIMLSNSYKGLDNGFSWWKEKYPYDYQAFEYLRENVTGKPTFIEGTNPTPYKDSKFFSATLNWNSVIGMPTHEVTWHNNSKEVWQRINDVEEFYKGSDREKSKEIINRYNVNFAVIGELESTIYGDQLQENKIKSMGTIYYQNDKTIIIKLH